MVDLFLVGTSLLNFLNLSIGFSAVSHEVQSGYLGIWHGFLIEIGF